jgi:hypothetical protein
MEGNCQQVAFILRNKTREDREELAEDQLRKAADMIRELRMSLLLFGVKK